MYNLIWSTVQLQYYTIKDKKPQSLFHWTMDVRDVNSRLHLPSSLLNSIIIDISLLYTRETFEMLFQGEDVILPLRSIFEKVKKWNNTH